MSEIHALYVEDEDGRSVESFERAIRESGFVVVRARSSEDCHALIADRASPMFDLVILDRKLPFERGGRAAESIGDALLESVASSLPDVPIVVLTGYSDVGSAKLALQRANALDVGGPEIIQRVQYFSKSETLEFQAAVASLGSHIAKSEDVALNDVVAKASSRRLIKRVGQHYDGVSVNARAASGGVSDAEVWICEVLSGDGRCVASLVVKAEKFGVSLPSGGFMSSVPMRFSAQPIKLVSGACGGLTGMVAPLAGVGAVSLNDEIGRDEEGAAVRLKAVLDILSGVPSSASTIPLGLFVEPLISWVALQQYAREFGVPLPSESLSVPSQYGCLHGDLHPGNVLLVDGEPVFIDFDRQRSGSLMLDVLSLTLGPIFNPNGAMRSKLPSLSALEDVVRGGASSIDSPWIDVAQGGLSRESFSSREKWASLLAYSFRQCKYPDVRGSDALLELAVGLAGLAAKALRDS